VLEPVKKYKEQNREGRDQLKSGVEQVLARQDPGRVVYAPNYWQWYSHHRNHGTLPDELQAAGSQLGMIQTLGLDVFSRNIYCDEQQCWFGGLCNPVWDGAVLADISRRQDERNIVWNKTFTTPAGTLYEQQCYAWNDSTLEQKQFLVTDCEKQADIFEYWLQNRSFEFDLSRWRAEQKRLPDGGIICAGEVVSPLKMLHLAMGAVQSVYFLMDEPDLAARWMRMHHQQQIVAMRQMLEAGVTAIMAMDNLDSQFHPPHYVEQYSAAFYQEAAALCHEHGATFWIHACGKQRANLELIASLGVDGLEGVAFPPMGDTTLPEAFELAGDGFIITGGISAIEFETLDTRAAVFDYVQQLFRELEVYRNRFMLSASCNTPINARWEQIVWFRDAWRKFCG
jgi:uroporphyrinogen decarboxylase-like protein